MARNLDSVKECLQYKGPPDPLRGDEIYKRVRDAAKESLDAIFDSQMPMTTSAVSNRIQGIGGGDDTRVQTTQQTSSTPSSFNFSFRNDNDGGSYIGATEGDISGGTRGATGYSNSSFQPPNPGGSSFNNSNSNIGNGSGGGSSGMTGIGNPNFKDPRNEVSLMQKMAALAEGALGSSSNNNNNNNNSIPSNSSSDYQMRSNRDSPFGASHKTSPYLPHISGPWNSNTSTSGTSPASPLPMSGGIVPDIPSIAGGLGRAGQAASDGSYEQTLVASLCEPGGMKAVPPEDKLEEFLITAPTLSPELIGSSLLGFINSDSWQSRAKALVVIGSLVKRSGCTQHYDWWLSNGIEDIQILSQTDSKATVKTQAIKTLRSLGVSVSASSVISSSSPTVNSPQSNHHNQNYNQSQNQNQVQKTSLLDFDTDETNDIKPQVIETQSNIVNQSGSIMNFLEQQPTVQVSNNNNNNNNNDNNNNNVGSNSNSNSGDNLFFGLSIGSGPSAPSGPPPPVPSQPPVPTVSISAPNSQTNSLFDFIDSTPQVQEKPPAVSIDLNSLYGPSPQQLQQQQQQLPPQPSNVGPLAGLNLSVPVRIPNQYPPQQPQYHQQGYPLPPQGYPIQQPGYPPQSYPSYPPLQQQQQQPQQQQYTPLAPSPMGMNNPQLGVRKVIPDATSGFSFLESNAPKKNPDDAFSFVKDAMQKK
eukprot:CAMPEP_0174820226 /NCGR_PEP_ID=MMETSP1107-20130205/3911_1 /TAXON_ID=36770 /ORGANISM="Paraphysomonas vestita, Strain GFlagA" /LENGTH=696 /DNA_ID=CAMNT_0016035147 /DNA_START=1922 /DNA_END=4012 /DNA_ORIENTATION=-